MFVNQKIFKNCKIGRKIYTIESEIISLENDIDVFMRRWNSNKTPLIKFYRSQIEKKESFEKSTSFNKSEYGSAADFVDLLIN